MFPLRDSDGFHAVNVFSHIERHLQTEPSTGWEFFFTLSLAQPTFFLQKNQWFYDAKNFPPGFGLKSFKILPREFLEIVTHPIVSNHPTLHHFWTNLSKKGSLNLIDASNQCIKSTTMTNDVSFNYLKIYQNFLDFAENVFEFCKRDSEILP